MKQKAMNGSFSWLKRNGICTRQAREAAHFFLVSFCDRYNRDEADHFGAHAKILNDYETKLCNDYNVKRELSCPSAIHLVGH